MSCFFLKTAVLCKSVQAGGGTHFWARKNVHRHQKRAWTDWLTDCLPAGIHVPSYFSDKMSASKVENMLINVKNKLTLAMKRVYVFTSKLVGFLSSLVVINKNNKNSLCFIEVEKLSLYKNLLFLYHVKVTWEWVRSVPCSRASKEQIQPSAVDSVVLCSLLINKKTMLV